MSLFSLQGSCKSQILLIITSVFTTAVKADCPGVLYDRAQTMECSVNQVITNCGLRFPVGTRVSYKCQKNYIPSGVRPDDYQEIWKVSVCQKNNNWWGDNEFPGFNCIIDYGKFYVSPSRVLLVMGGRLVNPLNFPWHAVIFVRYNREYKCGGTLISVDLILTAAHCTFKSEGTAENPYQPYELEVILAPVSGIYGDNFLPRSQKLLLSQIIRYNQGGSYQGQINYYKYDVALLRLIYPAQLNQYVHPAKLPNGYDIISDTMIMQVNGYGTTSPYISQVKPSNEFYGTNVLPNSPQCLSDPEITNTIDPTSQFCTTPTDPGSGVCSGDSGGGLFKREANDHWSMQGLVSFGYSAADSSGRACFSVVIFTRVQFFLPWIYQNMQSLPVVTPSTGTTSSARQILPSLTRSSAVPPDIANQVALSLHNSYRQRHGSPPLQIDYNLVSAAQEYVNSIVANNLGTEPKSGAPYGQNTYEVTGVAFPSDEAVRKAVTSWYNGISEYFWSAPLSSTYKGFSFSQVVWKSSLRLGVGVASQTDRSVVIAFYSPAGNIPNLQSYKDNVFPPQ